MEKIGILRRRQNSNTNNNTQHAVTQDPTIYYKILSFLHDTALSQCSVKANKKRDSELESITSTIGIHVRGREEADPPIVPFFEKVLSKNRTIY